MLFPVTSKETGFKNTFQRARCGSKKCEGCRRTLTFHLNKSEVRRGYSVRSLHLQSLSRPVLLVLHMEKSGHNSKEPCVICPEMTLSQGLFEGCDPQQEPPSCCTARLPVRCGGAEGQALGNQEGYSGRVEENKVTKESRKVPHERKPSLRPLPRRAR